MVTQFGCGIGDERGGGKKTVYGCVHAILPQYIYYSTHTLGVCFYTFLLRTQGDCAINLYFLSLFSHPLLVTGATAVFGSSIWHSFP